MVKGALSIPVKKWAEYADRLPTDKAAKIAATPAAGATTPTGN
jgi:hypothetical protein